MLKNLFGGKGREAAAPEGVRIYAIGDIHGCAALLDDLMTAIASDEAESPAKSQIVFLGDYVDRGPDSAGVVERLIAIAKARPDAIFLKGNHEAAFLDFLDDPEGAAEWLDWGGVETLESYDVRDPWKRAPAELAAELKTRAPAAHVKFLGDLALHHSLGDYFFVHAGVRPGVARSTHRMRTISSGYGAIFITHPQTSVRNRSSFTATSQRGNRSTRDGASASIRAPAFQGT